MKLDLSHYGIIEFPHLPIMAGITTNLMGDFKTGSYDIKKRIEVLQNIYGVKYCKQLVPVHKINVVNFTTDSGDELKHGDAMIYGNEGVGHLCFVHCSWITLAADILDNVMYALEKKDFWCFSSKQKVFIYPGICQSCYEVGEEVIDKLYYEDDHPHFEFIGNNKFLFNLSGYIRTELIEGGINSQSISTIPACSAHTNLSDTTSLTACNGSIFYSHRARQEKERNAIFARLPGDDNLIIATTGDCPYLIFYSPPG